MKRYELEHRGIPGLFFENCEEVMKDAEAREGAYFFERYQALDSPFMETQFDGGVLEMEKEINIYRVFLPQAAEAGDCVAMYFLYSREYDPLYYLTVEKNKEQGYLLFGWNRDLEYVPFGDFDGSNEREVIEDVIDKVMSGDVKNEQITDEEIEMRKLLTEFEIPFYDYELPDYIQMFSVIRELIHEKLDLPETVSTFAGVVGVMSDDDIVTSRDKMRTIVERFEIMPASRGKLDRKDKLFFGFCVYACCNVISENDEKKHYYMGLPEFESVDFIKYKMEEYWVMDPYMFSVI